MLLIILGVAIAIVTTIRVFTIEVAFKDMVNFCLIHALFLALGLLIACLGIGASFHGYHEPIIVQEYELAEIIEGSDVYIIEDSNKRRFFKYESNLHEAGINDPYKETDLEIVISDKYENPTLVEYYIEAKKGIFSMGLFSNIIDYKIYASEENIKRFE